ncbi:MAG TPA: hypothetical protein VHM48_07195, partial [Candidatus Limnocylindrales bacterium]|nr:hypothetical protein [Candidatus Limnocylindrales bacterium]
MASRSSASDLRERTAGPGRAGRLAPWRHLPDERHPGIQLAHPIHELLAQVPFDAGCILGPRQSPVAGLSLP